ncbi:hypothetical protein [Psychrobium sp. 1_MG-2023]|uniref:hypothetical protein n=1 Tax=Psychrobium sp. 1_MG-2023 TaxID=3062624 RepID=UPI000C34DB9E|nr:hypothetical protein [Psychrobium sp. 1_MG-2023]MDP2560606.1 hypothetical protein [Psychrobium sp. 1_MG-2023]PKF57592.1 hypothetical protein CW748_06820 [Alteromonadales bacterium alter-6D02]
MKPYKNIKTKHLGLLLFSARCTAVLGFLALGLTLILFIFSFVSSPLGGISLSSISFVTAIPMTIGLFGCSGVMAAVVALEEGYRQRTELLLDAKSSSN